MARPPAPGTRERLVDVASRLFYEHGVRAVGTARIVDEAGTGKNLLYRHFPTKDDLVASYLDALAGRLGARFRAAVAVDDPGDGLVAFVAEVGAQTRHPRFRGCAFRNYLAEFPEAGDAPGAVARRALAASRGVVDDLAARTGTADPVALAERIWLIVDALYLQAAYRDRLDAGAPAAVDAAVALARQTVDAAQRARRVHPELRA